MSQVKDATDLELVAALNTGDRIAFEAIYRKYVKGLFLFARKNISSKEDCEEIVQDIFESLWRRRGELNITSLRAYLFSMVKYKVMRYFRHSLSKKNYEEHYKHFEEWYCPPEVELKPDIDSLIEKRLAELPERCQFAVRLRLKENLSNGEIAKRMNVKKNTVEVYMFKAFNHLRDHGQELIGSAD